MSFICIFLFRKSLWLSWLWTYWLWGEQLDQASHLGFKWEHMVGLRFSKHLKISTLELNSSRFDRFVPFLLSFALFFRLPSIFRASDLTLAWWKVMLQEGETRPKKGADVGLLLWKLGLFISETLGFWSATAEFVTWPRGKIVRVGDLGFKSRWVI